jgi:hypothetical protein
LEILSPTPNTDYTPVSYQKEEKTDRNQKMIRKHQNGKTLAQIACDFDISITRVHQIVSKFKS